MILELQADAKMALARYESSVAAFGKEASFSIKDVHSVNDYISKLEAIVEKAADRIEQLEKALREKDNIAYIIDSHGMTHECFTIIYREKKDG